MLLAYFIDRLFGEFNAVRHPVVIMGDAIQWFEKKFYQDSIAIGAILTLSLTLTVFILIHSLTLFIQSGNFYFTQNWYGEILELLLLGTIASSTIASKMLYDSVKDIIKNPSKIKYLVSRDTDNLERSDINKAALETYAENLSDGVVAPLFYLLLFGLEGAFVYKAINTLDSMVGYRNKRYKNFGMFSAKLDDVANYIPARITAILISVLMGSKKAMIHFYSYGKRHESPNAGHPISAMALTLGVKLGGNTSYFGKIKTKPYFGDGNTIITIDDIDRALSFQLRLDILIIIISGTLLWV